MTRPIRYNEFHYEKTPLNEPGFVYIAKFGDLFKIGRSYSPRQRFMSLRQQLDTQDYDRFHIIPADDMREAEAKLHDILASRKVDGELFNLTEDHFEVLKVYNCFEAGSFHNRFPSRSLASKYTGLRRPVYVSEQ